MLIPPPRGVDLAKGTHLNHKCGHFAGIFGVSRDNKTVIELFIAGVRGWESGLQSQLNDAKPKEI